MQETTIRIFPTGEVCVASALLFGGEHCSALKASGIFAKSPSGCGCLFRPILSKGSTARCFSTAAGTVR